MIRRLLLFVLCSVGLLYGSYYSATDVRLRDGITLQYEDGIEFGIKKGKVLTNVPYHNFDKLVDGSVPFVGYATVGYKIKKKKETIIDPQTTKEKTIVKKIKIPISYNVYNFAYLLLHDIYDKEFLLKTKDKYLLVETDIDDDTLNNKILKTIDVTKLSYEVQKAYKKEKNQYKEVKWNMDEDILTKYSYEGSIVAVNILDKGKKELVRIITPKLNRFLATKKKLKTEVTNFDFSKEPIYIDYVTDPNNPQRLKTTYSTMKKNYIKIEFEGPVSVFDPLSKLDMIKKDVGYLKEFSKDLCELKKIEYINNKPEVVWKNNFKKYPVVIVDYMENGKKARVKFSRTKGVRFYGVEGLFYAISYMDRKNISKKVVYFVDSYTLNDVTLRKVGAHRYNMEVKKHPVWKFTLNNRHIITKMEFPEYHRVLEVERVDTPTTIKNKKYLKKLQREYNIVLIKE